MVKKTSLWHLWARTSHEKLLKDMYGILPLTGTYWVTLKRGPRPLKVVCPTYYANRLLLPYSMLCSGNEVSLHCRKCPHTTGSIFTVQEVPSHTGSAFTLQEVSSHYRKWLHTAASILTVLESGTCFSSFLPPFFPPSPGFFLLII